MQDGVATCERLLVRFWGEKSDGEVRPMRTIVVELRRKLADDAETPTYIFTEPRVSTGCLRGQRKRQALPPLPQRGAPHFN